MTVMGWLRCSAPDVRQALSRLMALMMRRMRRFVVIPRSGGAAA
jgi:hypothetical protein